LPSAICHLPSLFLFAIFYFLFPGETQGLGAAGTKRSAIGLTPWEADQNLSTPKKYSPHHQQLAKFSSIFFAPAPTLKITKIVKSSSAPATYANSISEFILPIYREPIFLATLKVRCLPVVWSAVPVTPSNGI
jgi:hypothetical protein